MNGTDGYTPRIVDEEIKRKLRDFGAILVKGPKWCGKTTTSKTHSSSSLYLEDPDNRDRYIEIAEMKVSNLLKGDNPRLIDEWQIIPKIWDAVRFDVDRRNLPGLYILTGSTLVDRRQIMHSGTGRIATVRMRTMSLWESGESDGSVSISSLFESSTIVEGESDKSFEDIASLIVRGGWPAAVIRKVDGNSMAAEYCRSIIQPSFSSDGRRKSPERLRKVMESLSRNISTSATNSKLLEDTTPDGEPVPSMNRDTLTEYLDYLGDISVTEDVSAWTPKLRSQVRILTGNTRYLTDPSIAAYFLGASAKDLEYDPETFGLLFEALVIRDLRIYVQGLDGEVYHYRDKNGLEVDAIVHLWDGRWGAVEVKLNNAKVPDAVESLLSLSRKVDEEVRSKLSFMAVITATGYAYTRPDGIHVIPIGCLKN